LSSTTGAAGSIVGGQVGDSLVTGGATAEGMVYAGQDGDYAAMINQGVANTGQIMADSGSGVGMNVQNAAGGMSQATQAAVDRNYGNMVAQATGGVGATLNDQYIADQLVNYGAATGLGVQVGQNLDDGTAGLIVGLDALNQVANDNYVS